jgi:inward rectifier potassium channel
MSAASSEPDVHSRWRHAPSLQPRNAGRRASWLEILYDVVVAGTMMALGRALAARTGPGAFMPFALAFGAVFFAWTAFTFYQNRFSIDDLSHRLLVGAKLLSLLVLGVSATRVLGSDTRTFSLAYAGIELVLAVVYARTFVSVPEARALTRYYGRVYLVGAVLWAAAAFVPSKWVFALWGVGVALGFSFPMYRRSRELALERPPDGRHMAERYGLVTSMALGQAVLAVFAWMTGDQADTVFVPAIAFFLWLSIWWLYFDDVANSSLRVDRVAPLVWAYSHLPLLFGITTAAAGVERLVHLEASAKVDDVTRGLLAGGLGLVLFALALIDTVTERRNAELGDRARVNARIAGSVLALLLYPIGAAVGPIALLAIAAVVCMTEVVFDLMMAPIVATIGESAGAEMLELARRRIAGEDTTRRGPPTGQTVRKGAPSELRRDFYFFFMEGPWSRLVLSLVFAYLTINAAFAALYLLEPGAIGGARGAHSFADAFFFSVQTFSTIGYGVLTPATPYGNLVVTAEAAVGLLSAAFATGLMFAKAARPHSSTLFSKVVVVTRRNGVPMLVFRVGNARGNDVVDATITVTALKEEISREGEHLRRMHELKLVRSRSPIFTMTWVVMHEIDDHSPLRHVDWSNPKDMSLLVVTLVGHDGTYGQTTYARKMYYPEDVRVGHRFVDVMSLLPDGRMAIDYSRFDDTVPEPASASLPENDGT